MSLVLLPGVEKPLRSIFERLKGSTLVRYVFVGGLGFLVELAIIFLSTSFFGASPTIAVTLSFWLGLLFSFVLQKLVAFGNFDRRISALGMQGVAYGALVLVNYLFTIGFAALAVPVIGIYFARAISLLITTGWNFFAYRYVIFNERVTGKSLNLMNVYRRLVTSLSAAPRATIMLIVSTALAVPLILLASMANLVADDCSYFTHIDESASPFAYAIEHYQSHNGRFSQALFVALSYALLGVHAVKIIPVFLLVAISLLLAWNIRLLVPFRSEPWRYSIALGLGLTSLSLWAMPSFFDTYLWLTSSSVYLGSIVALLLYLLLTIQVLRRVRGWPGLLVLCAFVMFFGQTFSEPTALFAIGVWGCLALWELFRRHWRSVGILALMWVLLVAGFLSNYLSPGTTARRSEVATPLNLSGAFKAALTPYDEVWRSLVWWVLIAILVLVALAATNVHMESFTRSRRVAWFGLPLLVFVGSTYFVFLVSKVGSDYYPLRNFTLPIFGTIISIAFLALAAFVLVLKISERRQGGALVVALGSALILVSVPTATTAMALQAQALSLRDSAITQRTLSVANQVASGAEVFEVGAAPVLTRSEAYDIQNPGMEQAVWVLEPFRVRSGIPAEAEMEILATPPSYCLPASTNVKAEFFCG